MEKNKKILLGVGISNLTRGEILEEIKKWLKGRTGFYQIVTINPEILVLAQKNKRFKKVLNHAQISTPDGIGIIMAGKILGVSFKERVTGVGLMEGMIKVANGWGLTVGLIGGKGDVALKAAECLKKTYPNFKFFALEGVKNVKKETAEERTKIISITGACKPQMLFIGFGAPWQEFFINSLKKDLESRTPAPKTRPSRALPLSGTTRGKSSLESNLEPLIAMGVGGAFDEISGRVRKVPKWIDKLGFKWLWRLACQPWRLRRQLALVEFILLVFKGFLKKGLEKDVKRT